MIVNYLVFDYEIDQITIQSNINLYLLVPLLWNKMDFAGTRQQVAD